MNLYVKLFATLLPICWFSPATAGDQFGSAEEAERLADTLIAAIDEGGLPAGIAAVKDPAGPFQATNIGVHIFDNSIIMADSRDPELETVSYAGVADLNGVDFWQTMVEAADGPNVHQVKWYSYDDETVEYIYDCHSKWQEKGSVFVWLCR